MALWARKKYYRLAKGFIRRNRNCARTMIPRVEKSLVYSFRDRKQRRRIYRREWILTIGSAVKEHYINYSRFICGINNSNMSLNRKVLADIARYEPYSFKAVVDEVKIQGKIEEKGKPEISLLEAYAKKLILDGPLKKIEKYEEPLPYFFGQRQISAEEQKNNNDAKTQSQKPQQQQQQQKQAGKGKPADSQKQKQAEKPAKKVEAKKVEVKKK